MSDNHIQLGILIVASLTFVALVWYAIETRRLRVAAQDQLEALAKPCLTLAMELRDPSDAILEMHQAVGNTTARGDHGNFMVHNIGNGVALNVSYRFRSLERDALNDLSARYFISVLPNQKATMPEPMNVSSYSGECQLTFEFDSIGGVRYESTVTMNHHVLTRFDFARKR